MRSNTLAGQQRSLPARNISCATALRYQGYVNPAFRLVRNLARSGSTPGAEPNAATIDSPTSQPPIDQTEDQINLWLQQLVSEDLASAKKLRSNCSRRVMFTEQTEDMQQPLAKLKLRLSNRPLTDAEARSANNLLKLQTEAKFSIPQNHFHSGTRKNLSSSQTKLNCVLRGVNRWQ